MKPADFELLASTIKSRSGLILTPEKAYLLESRLLPIVRKYNLRTLDELCDVMRKKREEVLLRDITEAMTTNESFFFRDQKPFTMFQKQLLPQLLTSRAAQKKIRIWSAASSSGQEAYSLAMICVEEAAKLQGWKVEIVGTDLSREMVERAKSGIYTQFEVQRGLPVTHLVKYFTQLGSDKWQIKENLRQMVQFKEGNLLQDLSALGAFDIVYCRNVLIYFDPPTKGKVLNAISRIMSPDGALILGGAETVLGITDRFKPAGGEHGLYVLNTDAPAATMTA